MDKSLVAMTVIIGLAMALVVGWDGVVAVGVVSGLSWVAVSVLRRHTSEKDFVTNVFLLALLLRLVFGIFVHVFQMRSYFGGDAMTYDSRASELLDVWLGRGVADPSLQQHLNMSGSGWGMTYSVALLYAVFGRNIFLAQSVVAVFGAATTGLVYFCSHAIFENKRVSKMSALLVAVFPAFVVWSGQLLKDGLIVFMLVLAMIMVIELQRRFSYLSILVLAFSLFGVLALRFYVFYMVVVAVIGSFIVGVSRTDQGIVRRLAVVTLVGLGLTYFGVLRIANQNVDRFGSLERIQISRNDLATAGSGFGEDVDVSTTQGALSAIPIGFTYLMLGPFPWQISSLRAAFTMPEVLIWWGMVPIIIFGLYFTVRNRFRIALPILIFSLMLTLAYSIFQGNAGTAYRQRTQLQVFLFIFFAVGWVWIRERRENRAILAMNRDRLRSAV